MLSDVILAEGERGPPHHQPGNIHHRTILNVKGMLKEFRLSSTRIVKIGYELGLFIIYKKVNRPAVQQAKN
jgi:hypothetical protein